MKLQTNYFSLKQLILLFTANLLLVSCGTYQSVYDNDGIYDDEVIVRKEKKVVVIDQNSNRDTATRNNYEDNYFSKRLDELENIQSDEIFTDVDAYNSSDVEDNQYNDDFNYNANQPWGYEDNDIIVHVNLMNDPFWGGFNNWGWGFNNPWRFRRGFRNWGFNSWAWGGNNWGFVDPWYPFYNNWGFINPYAMGGWNGGYLHPFLPNFGIPVVRNSRFANGTYRYGRRNTANVGSRRNSSVNSRNTVASVRNRNNRTTSNSTVRRNSRSTNPSRSSSATIRRNSSSNRNSSTGRRSSTIRRGSGTRTSSGTRGSSRTNRSYTPSRTSSSNRSSTRSSSRSSSTRSSSTRSSSSRSSSRSSSSRRSKD